METEGVCSGDGLYGRYWLADDLYFLFDKLSQMRKKIEDFRREGGKSGTKHKWREKKWG